MEVIKMTTSSTKINELGVKKYEKIVKGIAWKYSLNDNMTRYSREDLEQDMWLKICELTIDSEELPDEAFIAKCLWRHVTDKYRYHRRRAKTQVPASTEAQIEGSSNSEESSERDADFGIAESDWIERWKPMNADDYVMIHDVINLFEEGSKERRYAIAKLLDEGLLELSDKYASEVVNDYLDLPNYKEANFCSLVGYNSKKVSGSWLSKKNSMRSVVKSKLGI